MTREEHRSRNRKKNRPKNRIARNQRKYNKGAFYRSLIRSQQNEDCV